MENKNLKTTDFLATIKQMRMITVVAVLSTLVSCTFFALLYYSEKNSNEKEIYVVSDAGTFMAKRNDLGIRQEFEVKNHIRLFLENFYENDQYTFKANIERSLNLIDRNEGNKIYKGFNEKAYDIYVQNNAYSKVIVDSIKVDMKVRPYKAYIWFQAVLYYAGNAQSIRNAVVTDVTEYTRSEKNPFGLMLQNFNFIEYVIPIQKVEEINDSLAKANPIEPTK